MTHLVSLDFLSGVSGKYGPDQFFGIPTACPLNELFDEFG